MAAGIEIEGLAELNRAFKKVDKTIYTGLGKAIKLAAEPMRQDAQARAVSGITNITPRWAAMRIGATVKGAYMVPKAKPGGGGGSPRPNLAPMLYERAMAPSFEAHEHQIVGDIEVLLDLAITKAGF